MIPRLAQALSNWRETIAEPLSVLCRHRHNADYADLRVMPTSLRTPSSTGVGDLKLSA